MGNYKTIITTGKRLLPKAERSIRSGAKITQDECAFSKTLAPIVNASADTFETVTKKAETITTAENTSYRENIIEFLNNLFGKTCKTESQKISFKSYKEAKEYGKSRAVDALYSNEPYEHLVVIDRRKNKIWGEFKGDSSSVNIAGYGDKLPSGSQLMHGHPTEFTMNGAEITTPVSFSDFANINRYPAEEIVAFNKHGEFSLLRKKPNYIQKSKEEMQFYKFKMCEYLGPEFMKELVSRLPAEFADVRTAEQMFEKLKTLKETGLYTVEYKKALNIAYKEFARKRLESGDFGIIRGIHQFWHDFADELGLIYKTNYTYLK